MKEDKGQYEVALDCYGKCLKIQENVKGKGSFDTALTINQIGSVNKNMGNYPLALENYQKCL